MKKAQAVAPQGRQLAVGEGPAAKIRFGIILDINGDPVPITSDDIANAAAQGVEFTLQKAVVLGSIDKLMVWVKEEFKVSLPDPKDLPPPLNSVVTAITGIVVTVEKAHLKVPGSKDPAGVLYTIEANGMFKTTIPLIPNVLGINGFVFGFSNETPATPE
jgi:hypothetical protein